MPTATSDGVIKGRYTRRNSCSGEAPSIFAASSSSYGSLSDACFRTQIEYGVAIVTIARISAHWLLRRPYTPIVLYMGTARNAAGMK